IGIFNRSWYEDVLVVKVHPELVDARPLPPGDRGPAFWNERYEDISNFEQHLARNGVVVVKLFLNISKKEQKERFLKRLNEPDKHWKFSAGDLEERRYWDDYQRAYEDALTATSTEFAPWYVVPADHKWVARTVVSSILTSSMRKLDLQYPQPDSEQMAELDRARKALEQEPDSD
ncbi:MAG: polyphosphate kinase 2 family protein, partial [Planctomycetaceae bacterium]|nr:polyphosphate kinase 2 family protein [Planctomycetaceae bacterium]